MDALQWGRLTLLKVQFGATRTFQCQQVVHAWLELHTRLRGASKKQAGAPLGDNASTHHHGHNVAMRGVCSCRQDCGILCAAVALGSSSIFCLTPSENCDHKATVFLPICVKEAFTVLYCLLSDFHIYALDPLLLTPVVCLQRSYPNGRYDAGSCARSFFRMLQHLS